MPKRYGKHTTEQMKIEENLTENDKNELNKFKDYLRDSKTMRAKELLEKYGEYMGFSQEELKVLKAKEI